MPRPRLCRRALLLSGPSGRSQAARLGAALGLALLLSGPPTPEGWRVGPRTALAQQASSPSVDLSEEADLHFIQGIEAYRRADFNQALQHLLQSNRLVPNRNVTFNIARCYEQLGQFEAAYRHYHEVWRLESDAQGKAAAKAALDRIGPKVALVEVQTDPPGARVYVDRTDLGARGLSPQTLALSEGQHTLIAQLDGHEAARSEPVQLRLGQSRTVTLQLPQILGQLEMRGSPEGAELRLVEDGPVLGTIPGTIDLPPGQHVLLVSAPGHREARVPVSVQPKASSQASVELNLLTGTLVVDADESEALIEIDGQAQGFTPTVLRDVPVGQHTVRVYRAGFKPYEIEVEVQTDEEQRIWAQLLAANEVVGASRVAQSVEDAPASVTLISQQEIRAFGYETLYDALQGLRGVFPSDDRTYSTLGVRGLTRAGDYGNRMLITLDGHTLNDDQLGSSYVGRDFYTDLSNVQRIEFVRGPGSALYGSNAFFGVVNVVTADAEQLPRPQIEIAHGDARLARIRAAAGHSFSKKAGFWVSASTLKGQGEDLKLNDPLSGETTTVAGADETLAHSFMAKSWWGDLNLQAYYNMRDKRIPTGAYETILGDQRAHSLDRRAFIEARYEPRFGDMRLNLRAWIDHYSFSGGYPYADEDVQLLEDSWSGTWTGAEVRFGGQLAQGALNYTLGAEVRAHLDAQLRGQDAGGRFLDVDAGFQVYAAYALADWRIVRALNLNASLRFDHFTNAASSLSPRLALIYRPSSSDLIKLIAGRSFRAPSPYELYYGDGGITQVAANYLEPEGVITAEFEYSHSFMPGVQLIVGGFYNRIDSLIDLVPVEEQPGGDEELLKYTNIDELVHALGAELELRREWRQGWLFSGTYSYQHVRVGELSGGERLTNSPSHLAAVKLAAPLARTGLTIANRARLEGPRLTRAGDETDAALLWDLTLSGSFLEGHLDYALGVRNLLDWRAEHASGEEFLQITRIPQPGRTIFASLRGNY